MTKKLQQTCFVENVGIVYLLFLFKFLFSWLLKGFDNLVLLRMWEELMKVLHQFPLIK
jgi:hypothetical protein